MKNLYKLIGNLTRVRVPLVIIALVAVIGFSMAACKDDDNPWYVGTWKESSFGNNKILTITTTAYSYKEDGNTEEHGSFSISETSSTSGTMSFSGQGAFSSTYTYTIYGNTLSLISNGISSGQFTKQ